MRFKEWLQQEIALDISTPTVDKPSVTQQATMAKNTNAAAAGAINKFGTQIVDKITKAPSSKLALKSATAIGQNYLNNSPMKNDPNPPNALQVGSAMLKTTTGTKGPTSI
jgi:hypothetical protein